MACSTARRDALRCTSSATTRSAANRFHDVLRHVGPHDGDTEVRELPTGAATLSVVGGALPTPPQVALAPLSQMRLEQGCHQRRSGRSV